jgi:hypothetical protein
MMGLLLAIETGRLSFSVNKRKTRGTLRPEENTLRFIAAPSVALLIVACRTATWVPEPKARIFQLMSLRLTNSVLNGCAL